MGSNNEYEHKSNWEERSIEDLKKLEEIAVKGQWYKDAVDIREIRKKKENDAYWDEIDPEGKFREACKNLIDLYYGKRNYKLALSWLIDDKEVTGHNKEYKWKIIGDNG